MSAELPVNVVNLLNKLDKTDVPSEAMLLADEIYDVTSNTPMSDEQRIEISRRVGDRLEKLGLD